MMTSGTKTVAAAGTAERLTTQSFICDVLRVQALAANTTAAAVGGPDVDIAEGANLDPTAATAEDGVTFNNIDIGDVWVDVGTNSQGVSWVAVHKHPATSQVPLYGG